MANPKKMKDAIDEARKANGEPPRPKADKNPLPKPPVKVAAGPVKPSEETEAVLAIIADEEGKWYKGRGHLPALLALLIAEALVRRFPGLTRKPEVPRINYPDRLDAKMAAKGRLPVGSTVEKTWDGNEWLVRLCVTRPDYSVEKEFVASAPTSFKAEVLTDDLYRAWLAEKSPATPTPKETT